MPYGRRSAAVPLLASLLFRAPPNKCIGRPRSTAFDLVRILPLSRKSPQQLFQLRSIAPPQQNACLILKIGRSTADLAGFGGGNAESFQFVREFFYLFAQARRFA